nr:V-type ATPase 116kDa subunit family protein [uncultured Ruminococcus sp.]
MAVLSIRAVNIIGLTKYIDEVITVLGESGVFHPDEVSTFYTELQEFTHVPTNNTYAEHLTNLKSALNRTKFDCRVGEVNDYAPSAEELGSLSDSIVADIDLLSDKKEAVRAQLREAKRNYSVASHFSGLDVEIGEVLKLKYMKARFGKLPKDSMSKLSLYKKNQYVDFMVCTEDRTHCWGVYFTPADQAEKIDRIFEGLYFEPVELVGGNETPEQRIEIYKEQIPALEQELKEAQEKIDRYLKDNEEMISRCLSKLEEIVLYMGIRSKALQHGNSFIIVGWVPSENAGEIKKRLTKIRSVELDFSDAKKELDKRPPVKLKNVFFAKPFEFYTEMYGVPKYNEVDPTTFVSITYIIIFGIMFADLGQGFILSIVGWLMWKIRKMKIGKILLPCGISSMVFGTLFGSVFGFEHLLDPMYRSMGYKEKPFEVMASQNTNLIIFAAIGIGVMLLIVAMFFNVYSSLKQKNYGRALFSTSGVAGILFYGSLVFGLVSEMFLGSHVMTAPYIIGLVVVPFILIFFSEPLTELVNGEKDWQPESWGGYIVEKLFESIEILLSYVTNTMSFLRVGAFVLVHAGMMMVVFVLAETVGGVGYWVIVVIGNALVMVLEALLVAIQVLRLEYYELFSRFYSGEGRPFEPVRFNAETE